MANHPLRGSSVVRRAPILSVILVTGTAGCGLFQVNHNPMQPGPAAPAAPTYEVLSLVERVFQTPLGMQPDGTLLSVGDAGRGTLLVSWDLDAGRVRTVTTLPFYYSDLDLSSQRVLDCSNSSRTMVWDARTGKEIWTAKSASSEELASECRFGPGGREVYRAVVLLHGSDRDRKVAVFDGATGHRSRTQDWMPMEFFPDGKTALVADGKVLKRLEVPDGKVVVEIDPFLPAREVRISPDGSRVLVRTDRDVRVFDAQSGREVSRIEASPFRAVWTPDGRVMTGDRSTGSLSSWNRYDPATGRAQDSIEAGILGRWEVPCFSPDGRYLLLGDEEGLLIVNLESKRLVATAWVFKDATWATVTPQGFYAGADHVFENLSVRQANVVGVKPMYSFRQQLERPDVVAAALHTGNAEAAAAGAGKDHGGSARPQ